LVQIFHSVRDSGAHGFSDAAECQRYEEEQRLGAEGRGTEGPGVSPERRRSRECSARFYNYHPRSDDNLTRPHHIDSGSPDHHHDDNRSPDHHHVDNHSQHHDDSRSSRR